MIFVKLLHLESIIEQGHNTHTHNFHTCTHVGKTGRTQWWKHQLRSFEWCEGQRLRCLANPAGPVASLWLHPGWEDGDRPGWPCHHRGPGRAVGGWLVSFPAASQVGQKSHHFNSSCPGCSSSPTASKIAESFRPWPVETASLSVTSCKGDP